MNILDNVIILSLIILAFVAGMKISDRYHREAAQHEEYQLRLQNARIKSGDYAAYVAPPAKLKRQPMGSRFEDRLRQNGQATQLVNKDMPIS